MRKFVILVGLICAFSLVSCRNAAKKIVTKGTKETAETIVERETRAIIEEGVERASREITEGGVKKIIGKTLKELSTSDNVLKNLYDQLTKNISKEFADGITVKSTKEGLELVSKDFPVSKIKISNNMVVGNAGSLKNVGPVNEFLNHLMPNKTYFIDDCFIYKTDEFGRVVECSAKRSKAYKTIERNAQRNSDVQRHVIEQLNGRKGLDDAGHLFANTTGGPNELINQVPMASDLNRLGRWRELERIEEEALKAGKDVVSSRRLIYKGNSKRPSAIEFITKIDGVETRELVENI